MSRNVQSARLSWRCRRGMKELDVLLERLGVHRLTAAAAEDPAQLERLLELPDPLLYAYLLGGAEPEEAALAGLVGRLRALCRLHP
jgi:antitoxin CptB